MQKSIPEISSFWHHQMIHDTIELNNLKGLEHYQSKVEFANKSLRFHSLQVHINVEHFPLLSLSLLAEKHHEG